MVEFAFIVPLFMFIVLGMIYGGILFMDYLQYNNAARAIARDVAFTKNTDKTELEKEYFKPITKLYAAKIEDLTQNDSEVTIKISLKISQPLGLTKFIGFPPNELTPIKYVMPIETSAG